MSSGTYVRALARDLGAALGVGGHLTALRRTRVGAFTLDQAHTLDDARGAARGPEADAGDAARRRRPRAVRGAGAHRRRRPRPWATASGSSPPQPGRTEPVAAFAPDGTPGRDARRVRAQSQGARRVRPGGFVECPPCTAGPTPPRPPTRCAPAWRPSATSTASTAGHRAVLGAARRRGAASAACPAWRSPSTRTRRRSSTPSTASSSSRPGGCATTCSPTTGIDGLLVLDFTERVRRSRAPRSSSSAPSSRRSASRRSSSGEDTRGFGRGYTGDVATLRRAGGASTGSTSSSSTTSATASAGRPPAVRRHLAAGEVAEAAAILGRPHRMIGTVVHGAHRGRELGYPTANLARRLARPGPRRRRVCRVAHPARPGDRRPRAHPAARPSPSAPTPPSTGPCAPSRPTCSTAPTSTSTTRRSVRSRT